jgi:hypothetical protein
MNNFIDFFPTLESFKEGMTTMTNIGTFNDLEALYNELCYMYRYVSVLEPEYFIADFYNQTRSINEKFKVIEMLKKIVIKDIKDLVAVNYSKDNTITNDTPMQEMFDVFSDEINNSSEQTSMGHQSWRMGNLPIKLNTYKKKFSDGIRDIAKAYQQLFWRVAKGWF